MQGGAQGEINTLTKPSSVFFARDQRLRSSPPHYNTARPFFERPRVDEFDHLHPAGAFPPLLLQHLSTPGWLEDAACPFSAGWSRALPEHKFRNMRGGELEACRACAAGHSLLASTSLDSVELVMSRD